MYLSRLVPNLAVPQVLRDLADLQKIHRRVMEGFGHVEGPGRLAHGVLWRWDTDPERTPTLYVQSSTLPDWSNLPRGYLSEPAQLNDLSALRPRLTVGRRFAFRLVASVTKSISGQTNDKGERIRGKRVPIGDPEEQVAWLQRQAETKGFIIEKSTSGRLDLRITELPRGSGIRETGKVDITPIRFEGRLALIEVDAFWEALTAGIGRAKAYGCGLLSLSRP